MLDKLKDMAAMRKQASQMKKMLADEHITVEGYHGKLKLTIDGNQEVESIEIDPEILSSDNKDTLEREMANLFNNAVKDVQKMMARKLQSGEISMPF
ncbi:YbaB/EbfC family nucleoid-associated protein [Patescibacteria group bacterium]|nr:YbaB/EbfC family nucleoid-associated protein [Patescibacteria group bacterium]